MSNGTYEMAYVEVLEIIKHLPKYEQIKIPKSKIEFYEKYKDKNYNFKFNEDVAIEEQRLLRKTRTIMINLFRDFFANDIQKQKIEIILKNNSRLAEEEKRRKYNPDNIFKDRQRYIQIEQIENENTSMVTYKESFFSKIIRKIKLFFHK